MREADANDTSGELGRHSVFRTAKPEMLIEPPVDCLSCRLFRSARVNGEHRGFPVLLNMCL